MLSLLQLDSMDSENYKIREFLVDLGRRHFSYGARPHHMELLGHTFVDSFIIIFEGEKNSQDIHEAWLAFFAYVVYYMHTGFKFVQNKGGCIE